MGERLQRLIAWAKANPVLAGGIVIVAALAIWLIARSAGSGSANDSNVVESADELGGGGGIGGDDLIPMSPIPEFLIPEPGYLGGDGGATVVESGGYDYPPTGIPQAIPVEGSSGRGWGAGEIVQTFNTPQQGEYSIRSGQIVQRSPGTVAGGVRGFSGTQTITKSTPVVWTPGVVAVQGSKRQGSGRIIPAQTVVRKTPVVFTPRTVAIEGTKRGR
jgi:hypothetical protein